MAFGKRITGVTLSVLILGAGLATMVAPPHWRMIAASWATGNTPPAANPDAAINPVSAKARSLIDAAEGQIGVTVTYDGSYQGMDYPGGDIDISRGVCTDVVIRALRNAHGLDLQQLVHEDMRAAFAAYPNNWGLSSTDRNIDHRRVPNLRTYFNRAGYALPVSDDPADFKPGDVVTWTLPGNLPHIGIITDRMSRDDKRPLIVHNVGAGTALNDFLFSYPITGHYRLFPDI